ncbi:MAG: hypothetical protein H7Y07_10255 [Pyrinomonadaceae bacterium]|nr:hypothetical protein [Sphingobacteriaceae bacterium]
MKNLKLTFLLLIVGVGLTTCTEEQLATTKAGTTKQQCYDLAHQDFVKIMKNCKTSRGLNVKAYNDAKERRDKKLKECDTLPGPGVDEKTKCKYDLEDRLYSSIAINKDLFSGKELEDRLKFIESYYQEEIQKCE